MGKLDVKYALPFGPDIVVDGLGRCLTPKPEPYVRIKYPTEARMAAITEITTLQKSNTNGRSKIIKSILSDIYTSSLILFTIAVLITWLLCRSFIEQPFEQENFDPDSHPDYALEAAGASIHDEPNWTPYTVQYLTINNIFNLWRMPGEDREPRNILQAWRSPGECWAFSGQQASVRIRLSHRIIPRAVTLEHISKSLSPIGNINSAPRLFSVYALEIGEPIIKEHYGNFEYLDNGQSVQSFLLYPEGGIRYPIRVIEFSFQTNHGNPHYTCVYKIRVHGDIFS